MAQRNDAKTTKSSPNGRRSLVRRASGTASAVPIGKAREEGKRSKATRKRRANVGQEKRPTIYAGVHHATSKLASIEDVLNSNVTTRLGSELSMKESIKLTLTRIRNNKNYIPMMMLGIGDVIDKKRAIAEIRTLSAVGVYLMQIEHRWIRMEIEDYLKSRGKK